jgi:hypothetical protein
MSKFKVIWVCCEILKRLAFSTLSSIPESHEPSSETTPNPSEIQRMSKLFVGNILDSVMQE